MRKRWQWISIGATVPIFFSLGFVIVSPVGRLEQTVGAQAATTPAIDKAAELAKLRESIKGRETEPASAVFKNIQSLKAIPASNLLAIMDVGFSRSLGVDCTHCHVPGKWDSDEKIPKQTAREMWAMMLKLNS